MQGTKRARAALVTSTAIIAIAASSPIAAKAATFDMLSHAATASLQGADAHLQANDAQAQTPGAGVAATSAAADDKTDDDTQIVVTGTRIRRPNVISAAPITSVTASEIQAQAAVNIEEVLNRLPQVAPDNQQSYQDSDGRQRIKLRNLGFERTLTLVDGKRLGTQNGVDVGMIPTALVERIDILSGGASSVYGSDAVAGVVNFILKKDFTGIQLDTNYNFYNHDNRSNVVTQTAQPYGFGTPLGMVNDGARADVTVTAGKHFFDDALKISVFGDYRKVNPVNYTDRSTSACQLNQTAKDGPLTCQTSTYSPNGYISPQSGPNAGSVFLNNPNGTRTFVATGNTPGLATNPYDDYPAQRQVERFNAGGFVSLKLADALELYGSGLWFHDKSDNPYPARIYSYTVYGSTPYQVNCNNPFLSAGQATAICGTQAGTSTLVPIELRYRFNALPSVPDTYINQGANLTAGIRGKFADVWHYDLTGIYARNRQDYTSGSYPVYARVNNSLNVVNVNGVPTCVSKVNGTDPACVPFDAFAANNSSTALGNYLFANQDGTQITRTALYDAVFNLTGDLGKYGVKSPWAEQGVALALGAEYREDQLNNTADAIYRASNGGSDAFYKQHVMEANFEVQVPVIEKRRWADALQINGGYRISKYNGISGTFGTWKIEGLYAPVAGLTFRGSFNKAQRAPTVVELSQANTIQYGVQGGSENDFCATTTTQEVDPTDPTGTRRITVKHAPTASREVCAATGLTGSLASLYGSETLSCPNSQCTIRQGGYQVNPETAYTKTFGVLVQPKILPRFSFSVDRYLIDLKDSIAFYDYSYYQSNCAATGLAYFCQYFVRDPTTGILYNPASTNPTSGFIRQGTTNAYKTKSHGWDFQAQYTLITERLGSVEWLFNGSLATLATQQDNPTAIAWNSAGGYYGPGSGQLIPKWSHGLRTTYTTPDKIVSVSLNWRLIGRLLSTTNTGLFGFTAADVKTTFYRIPTYNYFDLAVSFRIAKQFGLRISANNLLDKDPPILPNSYSISLARNNTLPQRYDSLGRNIAIGTTLKF